MEQYSFIKPENYQPRGYADFSKIITPKTITVTFTNLVTREKEDKIFTRTTIFDEKGFQFVVYS